MADGLGLTDLLDGYGGHGGNRVLSVEDVSEAGVFDRGDPGDLDQGRCKGRHARTVAGGPGQQEKDRRRRRLRARDLTGCLSGHNRLYHLGDRNVDGEGFE